MNEFLPRDIKILTTT